MTTSRPIRPGRLGLAAILGAAAGGALWTRAAEIEPHLDLKVIRTQHSENYDVWTVTIQARGGEPIDEVRIEPVAGPVSIVSKQPYIRPLPAGWSTYFRVQVEAPGTPQGVVRIIQTARVSRTYEVPLVDAF